MESETININDEEDEKLTNLGPITVTISVTRYIHLIIEMFLSP